METCNSEVAKISNSDFTLAIFLNFWIFFPNCEPSPTIMSKFHHKSWQSMKGQTFPGKTKARS